MTDDSVAAPRVMTVVRGKPSPEELAAVVALVAARSDAEEAGEESTPSRWNPPASLHRRPLPHGPGAWRATAFRG